jgi:hypothetical protein
MTRQIKAGQFTPAYGKGDYQVDFELHSFADKFDSL